MYEIYIARTAEIFGVSKTSEIYEQIIDLGLPNKDEKVNCPCACSFHRRNSHFFSRDQILVASWTFILLAVSFFHYHRLWPLFGACKYVAA